MINLITGVIGIAMMLTFMGVLLWWIKAVPLIIIAVFVAILMIYDFIETLRFGDATGRR